MAQATTVMRARTHTHLRFYCREAFKPSATICAILQLFGLYVAAFLCLTGFACFAAGGGGGVLWGWATDPSCGEQLYCAPEGGGSPVIVLPVPPPPRLNNEL